MLPSMSLSIYPGDDFTKGPKPRFRLKSQGFGLKFCQPNGKSVVLDLADFTKQLSLRF